MRTSPPDESQLMLLVFDLLHQDGVDLRGLPLSERKRDLHRLCVKSRVPFLKEVQTFPNGPLLFDHCNKFGFKGVVSKRLASRYSSGPSRNWVKTKCPGWNRINAERHRLFEGPPRKPVVTAGRVEMWRGGCRLNISVAASFVWRCLSGSTMTPFPHPAHRTGHADLPHPALGQDFTPSPTARRAQAGTGVRARSARKGARVDKSRPCVA